MDWLIDGMNVIGAGAGGWWKDPDRAIRTLVEQLQEFVATGEPVTVVFDYRPRALRVGTAGGVKVRFADGKRDAADQLILEIVNEHPAPETVRVVTSDKALRMAAEASGAEVMSAGTFRSRLGARGNEDG